MSEFLKTGGDANFFQPERFAVRVDAPSCARLHFSAAGFLFGFESPHSWWVQWLAACVLVVAEDTVNKYD